MCDLLSDLPRDTLHRYEMAWKIAEVSVKDGLHQLSMDAAVIALENGPPIKPISIPPGENSAAASIQALRLRNSSAIRTSSPSSQSKIPTTPSETIVALEIEALSKEWLASGATQNQLTDALFQIVFPQRQSGFYCYSTAEDASGKLVFDNMASATSAKITHYSAVGELLRTSYSAGSIGAVLDEATRRSQGSVTRESKTMQMQIAAHLLAGESNEARGLWNEFTPISISCSISRFSIPIPMLSTGLRPKT